MNSREEGSGHGTTMCDKQASFVQSLYGYTYCVLHVVNRQQITDPYFYLTRESHLTKKKKKKKKKNAGLSIAAAVYKKVN